MNPKDTYLELLNNFSLKDPNNLQYKDVATNKNKKNFSEYAHYNTEIFYGHFLKECIDYVNRYDWDSTFGQFTGISIKNPHEIKKEIYINELPQDGLDASCIMCDEGGYLILLSTDFVLEMFKLTLLISSCFDYSDRASEGLYFNKKLFYQYIESENLEEIVQTCIAQQRIESGIGTELSQRLEIASRCSIIWHELAHILQEDLKDKSKFENLDSLKKGKIEVEIEADLISNCFLIAQSYSVHPTLGHLDTTFLSAIIGPLTLFIHKLREQKVYDKISYFRMFNTLMFFSSKLPEGVINPERLLPLKCVLDALSRKYGSNSKYGDI